MQLSITFEDSGFSDVLFTASRDSLVKDVVEVAAGEWGADSDIIELTFDGSLLPAESRLLSHSVENGSLLVASRLQDFHMSWLFDVKKREKLQLLCQNKLLRLDTPSFVSGRSLEFEADWLPTNVRDISFRNSCSSLTVVSDGFLRRSQIESLYLTGLSSTTSIGDNFLEGCSSLTTVDLLSLPDITRIGDNFLEGCDSLTGVDLVFNNLTSISNSFLYSCSSISFLDLSHFNSVTSVGSYFLCESRVTEIDLSGLRNLTSIGDGFLCWCDSITEIDLSVLRSLTSIKNDFLRRCGSLEVVDFSKLDKLTSIGDGFLRRCESLQSLDLTGLRNVTSIGDDFISEYKSPISLSCLSSLTENGSNFPVSSDSNRRQSLDSISEREIIEMLESLTEYD